MEERLQSLDRFLSTVVSLIPTHLYQHTLSEDALAGNDAEDSGNKYFKHKKQPLSAGERKILSAKRKLDVYGGNPSVDNVESIEISGSSDEGQPKSRNAQDQPTPEISGDLEVLRLKLQEKILGFKIKRNAAAKKEDRKNSKVMIPDSKNKNDHKKNKSKSTSAVVSSSSNAKISVNTTIAKVSLQKPATAMTTTISSSSGARSADADLLSMQQDLQFSNMVLPTTAPSTAAASASTGGAKTQRLKRLLAETEKKRARLNELTKSQSEQGSKRLKTELWNDALKSATGEKPISGSKGSELKIKKALKRKQKGKEKSALEWQARLDAVGEAQAAKVQKREANLRNRHQPQVPDATTTNPTAATSTTPSTNANHSSKNSPGTTPGSKGTPSKAPKHNNKSSNSNSNKAKSPMRRPGFEGRFKQGEFLNQKS